MRFLFCFSCCITFLFSSAVMAQTNEHSVCSTTSCDTLKLDNDSLQQRPVINNYDLSPSIAHLDYNFLNFDTWSLHNGLNVQFGLNVTTGFGKHAPRGVGFGQNAAFMYLAPITPKLSVAGGVYARNMNWNGYRDTEIGISGMLSYQANDNLSFYTYISKRITHPKTHFFGLSPECYPYETPDLKYGAGANFKLGNAASLQVNIEFGHDTSPLHNVEVPSYSLGSKLDNGILWDCSNSHYK